MELEGLTVNAAKVAMRNALLHAINWWVWPRSAKKKWGGHVCPIHPTSYATVALKLVQLALAIVLTIVD